MASIGSELCVFARAYSLVLLSQSFSLFPTLFLLHINDLDGNVAISLSICNSDMCLIFGNISHELTFLISLQYS